MEKTQFDSPAIPLWLEGLNSPWERVVDLGEYLTYEQGENLIFKGDSTKYMFYLQRGGLQTWCEDDGGEVHLNLLLGPGMLFNDMVCMSGIHMRDFYVFTEDSDVIRFEKSKLFTEKFCQQNSDLLINLASVIARKGILLSEFRTVNKHLETINRVARILYNTFMRFGGPKISGLSQDEIASALKVHRSSVARVIQKMKQEGIIIKATKRELVIADKEALKQLAMGNYIISNDLP